MYTHTLSLTHSLSHSLSLSHTCHTHTQITIIYYWTDDRMKNQDAVPKQLWAPRFAWANAWEIKECTCAEPILAEKASGRMKMWTVFTGTVDNPMHLEAFPFDVDDIMFEFITGTLFRLGEADKEAPTGKLFEARPIREQGEGNWINPRFQGKKFEGKIAEWVIRGISTRIEHMKANALGKKGTTVYLGVHVTRNSGFYFWCVQVLLQQNIMW